MSSKKKKLIVFTRYPEPGQSKTRLIPVLGPKGAADLQRQMTERMLNTARRLTDMDAVAIDVYFCGGDEALMQDWLGTDFTYRRQSDGGLDRRMGQAFVDAFDARADAVVIVGSDIPGVTAAILNQAFTTLEIHDLVLGPAADGGYYLIGLNRKSRHRALPRLLEGIDWGSADVLTQTLHTADILKLTTVLLAQLADVDRPEDLSLWQECRR